MKQDCPTDQKLSAYHDGELAGDEQSFIARHLAWCEACSLGLLHLQKMSALVQSGGANGISQIALRRLHDKLDEVMERGLVRWAWEVSGIAAAILLVGSVWLMHLKDPATVTATTAGVPPWVDARVSADPVIQVAATPAAAWYLVDARDSADIGP